MSDNQQLARTGAGALVIGTTVITGWYLLAIALTIVVVGALIIRFAFRPGIEASQGSNTEAGNDTEAGQP